MIGNQTIKEQFTKYLSDQINCGNLSSIDDVEALIGGISEEMKRKEILAQHTPPLHQLPNGHWYTRVNGKKIDRKEKADAEDAIIKAYSENIITLKTIFDNFLKCRKKETAATTWSKDIKNFHKYIETSKLGDIPLTEITIDDGYDFLDHCFEIYPDMKKKYWDGVIGTVNQMFLYAIEKRFLNSKPFAHLKPKSDLFTPATKTREADTVFTKREQAQVTDLAKQDSLSTKNSEPLGIVLLFNTGIRIGELCALKWGDIELRKGKQCLHIQREMVTRIDDNGKISGFKILPHCKTPASNRKIILNEEALKLLNEIKQLNLEKGLEVRLEDYIFLRLDKGEFKNCSPRSFDPRIRKYCRQADMEVIKSCHDIRRTVLTNLYMAGMPVKKIQEYAGHSTLQQTLDYIRVTDDDFDTLCYLNTLSDTEIDNIIQMRHQA